MSVRRLLALAVACAATLTTLGSAPAGATPATPVYVALGDSYSSGEGACKPVVLTGCDYRPGSNTAGDQCHRSRNAYGARVAAKLPHGWRFSFVACSGADTGNVLTTGQYGEPAQLAALDVGQGRVVKLVTLTLGGNDAGFSTAGSPCVTAQCLPSSCHGKIPTAISQATLRARLTAVYGAIHRAAPSAK